MNTPITQEAIAAGLTTHCFGHPLLVAESLPSTNTYLQQQARLGAPEGTTVIARLQTGGRGRRGRQFHSPQGGLYLSTLLRPTEPVDPGLITSCAAVAAARAIESLCDLSVGIKWVNDLFVRGRKACGILAQADISPQGQLDNIILGWGINVTAQELPPDIAAIATTLGNEGADVDSSALAAALLNHWEQAYACMADRSFLEESRQRSVVLGKTVQVIQGDTTYPARAEAITDEGHLVVRTDAGEITLHSGEVSLRL